jgi:site-specific DNA-methyltransferase (adenine-specific)
MDCVDFLNTFEDNSIDLLITDPPYSTDVKNINDFAEMWVDLALSKIKENGRAYICIGGYPKEINAYLNILLKQSKFIVDNPLIWSYKNTLGITPKMKYNLNYQIILHLYSENSRELDTSITNEMWSVMEINAPDGRIGNRYHTWQKPDELGMRLIKHSTIENDLVVDCFACTGTFVLMAAKLNRIAKGCDIDENNLLIAKQRGCITIGI